MDDAHLNSTQYNWLSSIFYFGYLLAEWPQNWCLQRFPVAKWLAGNLIIWYVPNYPQKKHKDIAYNGELSGEVSHCFTYRATISHRFSLSAFSLVLRKHV